MKLLLTNTKLQNFCDIIANCKYLSEVITFTFSNDGIYSQGLSLDHCAIYDLTMGCDWFDDYEWEQGKDATKISVTTELLSKVLHTRQPSQFLVIEYNGNPDEITVRFSSTESKGKNKEFPKEFSLSLIDVDSDTLEIPDMEYSAEFEISTKALQVTNDQLSLFNETLTIHSSEEEIFLCSKGSDGELKVTLFDDKCEHITEFSIEEDLSLTLDFSIKHFNSFCRFLKVSDNVVLSFKENAPMKFEYLMKNASEEENENLKLIFYLAPKISDEDE